MIFRVLATLFIVTGFSVHAYALSPTQWLAKTACEKLLFKPDASIPAENPVPQPFVLVSHDFEKTDGTLQGLWHITNPNAASKGSILHFRAGTISAQLTRQWAYLENLAQDGFEVYELGYDQSKTGGFESLIQNIKLAVITAVESAQKTGGPIYLYGQSLGGYLLLKTFAELPASTRDALSGIIVESAFVNPKAIGQKLGLNPSFSSRFMSFTLKNLPSDWCLSETELKEITIPTLVISSKIDPVVPASQSRQIMELGGPNFEYFQAAENGHLFGSINPEVNTKLTEFFKRTRLRF